MKIRIVKSTLKESVQELKTIGTGAGSGFQSAKADILTNLASKFHDRGLYKKNQERQKIEDTIKKAFSRYGTSKDIISDSIAGNFVDAIANALVARGEIDIGLALQRTAADLNESVPPVDDADDIVFDLDGAGVKVRKTHIWDIMNKLFNNIDNYNDLTTFYLATQGAEERDDEIILKTLSSLANKYLTSQKDKDDWNSVLTSALAGGPSAIDNFRDDISEQWSRPAQRAKLSKKLRPLLPSTLVAHAPTPLKNAIYDANSPLNIENIAFLTAYRPGEWDKIKTSNKTLKSRILNQIKLGARATHIELSKILKPLLKNKNIIMPLSATGLTAEPEAVLEPEATPRTGFVGPLNPDERAAWGAHITESKNYRIRITRKTK